MEKSQKQAEQKPGGCLIGLSIPLIGIGVIFTLLAFMLGMEGGGDTSHLFVIAVIAGLLGVIVLAVAMTIRGK